MFEKLKKIGILKYLFGTNSSQLPIRENLLLLPYFSSTARRDAQNASNKCAKMRHVHEFKQGSCLPIAMWSLLLQVLFEKFHREDEGLPKVHAGESISRKPTTWVHDMEGRVT